MKIAVLIQCHKNFDQINRLIRALKHPAVDIFIHIDRKAQKFRNMIRINEHVFILPENQCVDVQWAQISQVQASLNLIEYAMKENLKVKSERFVCDRGGAIQAIY